jgi:predicted nucleic acid-binding Zn ribbon protein
MSGEMEPLGRSLPQVLAELLRTAPLTDGKVEFAWKAAVGAALERATRVKLENGVLLVEAASRAWAREVMRGSPLILQRLQALLGRDTVREIAIRNLS